MAVLAAPSVNPLSARLPLAFAPKSRCIRSTLTEMQSMSENGFEMLASTGWGDRGGLGSRHSSLPHDCVAHLVFAHNASYTRDEHSREEPPKTNLSPVEPRQDRGRKDRAKRIGEKTRRFAVPLGIGVGLPALDLPEPYEREGIFQS